MLRNEEILADMAAIYNRLYPEARISAADLILRCPICEMDYNPGRGNIIIAGVCGLCEEDLEKGLLASGKRRGAR